MCFADGRHLHQTQSPVPDPSCRSPCCSWSFLLTSELPQTCMLNNDACCEYQATDPNLNHTSLSLLPCSGFRLSCIVHLFLLPNVLLFLNIIKLLYPFFTAGFKGSGIGLGTRARMIKSAPQWFTQASFFFFKSFKKNISYTCKLTLLSSASRLKFISAILSNVALRKEIINENNQINSMDLTLKNGLLGLT